MTDAHKIAERLDKMWMTVMTETCMLGAADARKMRVEAISEESGLREAVEHLEAIRNQSDDTWGVMRAADALAALKGEKDA